MGDSKDEIDGTKPSRSYLIPYSQADLQKFPTRESFGEAVAAAFSSCKSKVVPQHWACCMEKHSDHGYHYHASLKLSGTKKWLEAKRTLEAQHRISVHFSDHNGYYSTYRYISKYDENISHSEQRQEEKKDLANYVLSRITKSLNYVIKQKWKMKKASSDLKRQQTSRMELINTQGN